MAIGNQWEEAVNISLTFKTIATRGAIVLMVRLLGSNTP
jgi:hypothetical protein